MLRLYIIMEVTIIFSILLLMLSICFLRFRQGGGRGQEDEPALHLLCAGGQRGHGRRPDPQDPDVPRPAVGGGDTTGAENEPSRIHALKLREGLFPVLQTTGSVG